MAAANSVATASFVPFLIIMFSSLKYGSSGISKKRARPAPFIRAGISFLARRSRFLSVLRDRCAVTIGEACYRGMTQELNAHEIRVTSAPAGYSSGELGDIPQL